MKRFAIWTLVMMLLLSGCAGQKVPSGQRLNLTVTEDENAFEHFPAEYFQGNSDSFLRYNGISGVEITLDGKSYPLEEAMLQGLVSTEEIRAWAAMDARSGLCTTLARSRNGLSHFIYSYPDLCDLYFCQDVYETPDGKQHIFHQFAIYPYNETPEIYFIDAYEDENGDKHNLDEENWGLTFEIQNLSPAGFDLEITQRSGTNRYSASQHVGQLTLKSYRIVPMMDSIPEELQSLSFQFFLTETTISNNNSSTISIRLDTLENAPEALPSGRYQLILEIADEFNEDEVHPLMQDFHLQQTYFLYFEIK